MGVVDQAGFLTSSPPCPAFADALEQWGLFPLHATGLEILQINVTRRCNLACKHCHAGAGPGRSEIMTRETLALSLEAARHPNITTIDITGGAPELNPNLPWFLQEASRLGKRLLVRSNLIIYLDEAYAGFADLCARLGVELVGSLPDYRADRTDRQRGQGTFEKSIDAIRLLNEKGYGREGTGLVLDLVHNPAGAYLPGAQQSLEREYKTQLSDCHGVDFSALFCLTNCPVGRYLDYLVASDNYESYMGDLHRAFNPAAAKRVMCRTTLSVGWDGTMYDCDFNQMLGLGLAEGAPGHIGAFDYEALSSREIVINNHCYSCTAGAGSSCQGTVS
jgi:radical SAM/Cys-rich protein